MALSGAVDAENDNIRVQLLADIRDVFASTQRDRLPTVELIAELSAMEDRPWCEANRGKRISARWLAARLRAFGITVGAKRSGETVFKVTSVLTLRTHGPATSPLPIGYRVTT